MMHIKSERGFSYLEVLWALPIILLTIFAATTAIFGAARLNERSRAYTKAMNLGIYRLEEIRNSATETAGNFQNVMLGFNGARFPQSVTPPANEVTTLQGLGLDSQDAAVVTRVTMLSSDVADVRADVFYRFRNGQLIGEDRDLDGTLDGGEDSNGNGRLDSPIAFHTLVARK